MLTSNFKKAALPLMISSVLVDQAAFAQDASKDAVSLDSVTVVAKDEATVIDSKTLERLNPTDLQDLFRTTPGVQVSSSLAISQKVYLNGIEETNLSVTIDGARQNNKLFHHSGTNLIDPQLLKAVKVHPGVAPADAGPGALGGSIAYETKDASELLAPGDNFGGAVGLQYTSNGDTFTRDVSVFGRSKTGLEALAYLKKADGDEFEDGDGDEVFASGAALTSGLVKVGYLADGGYRTKLSVEQVEDDADRPFRANFLAVNPVATDTQRYKLERRTVVFSIEDETPEGLLNPYVRLASTDSKLETGDAQNSGTYESVNGTVANTFVLDSGLVNAGVDFYSDSAQGDFPSYGATWTGLREEAKNIGVFAQSRMDLSEDARISFGARHDSHELKGLDGSKSDNNGVSVNLSGEYDVTPSIVVSAGVSNVFGGVQLAEPYIVNPSWAYPAGGLESSDARNHFVGLKYANDTVSLGVKVFSTDIEDVRDENYRGGPDIYSDVESTGFELTGRYNWDAGFAQVTYVDTDTEINGVEGSTEGMYLGTSIGQVLKAEVVHTLAEQNITLGADVQHYFALDGYDVYDNVAVADAFPSYTVANASVSYTPASLENLKLRLSVNNLFDETYADRASYGHEYVESYGTQILNEPGRSFILSAKYHF